MTPERHLRQLAGLAAGLCLDAGVRLQAGDKGWSWEPERRTIHVSRKDLDGKGPTYCAGVLAHEVGHYHISRYHLFKSDFPSRAALDMMLNGIEDPRVNTWIQYRYPGTFWWFLRLAEVDGSPREFAPLPSMVRYAIEAAREELNGWNPLPEGAVPQAVREALAATFEARQRYANVLPPASLSPRGSPGELARKHEAEVSPRLNKAGPRWLGGWEQEVRCSAIEALTLAEEQILPTAARLWLGDVERMGRYLTANPVQKKKAREAVGANNLPHLIQVVQAAYRDDVPAGTQVKPGMRDLARRVLEAWLRGIRAPEDGPLGARPLIEGGDPELGTKLPEAYIKAHHDVANQIERLVKELEEVLRPRRRLSDRAGFPSGKRLDLRRAMAFAADPRRHDKLWRRPTIPRRRDTTFLLLVDLSGSMRGEKTPAAIAGTVLLSEALERLAVPYAVYGFQDVLIPFVDFMEGLNPVTRHAIGSMGEEIAGTRPGGNNQPLYNDDGPCLAEAANLLLDQPGREHVLIVVSDGIPEGRRSQPDDLHTAVREANRVSGLRLVGIGLGPGTEHVKTYYPESIASVPVDRLADEIGLLLRQALLADVGVGAR
jgi:hypothetical protein